TLLWRVANTVLLVLLPRGNILWFPSSVPQIARLRPKHQPRGEHRRLARSCQRISCTSPAPPQSPPRQRRGAISPARRGQLHRRSHPDSWHELAEKMGLIRPHPPHLHAKITDIEQVLRLELHRVALDSSLRITTARSRAAQQSREDDGSATTGPST